MAIGTNNLSGAPLAAPFFDKDMHYVISKAAIYAGFFIAWLATYVLLSNLIGMRLALQWSVTILGLSLVVCSLWKGKGIGLFLLGLLFLAVSVGGLADSYFGSLANGLLGILSMIILGGLAVAAIGARYLWLNNHPWLSAP